MDMKQLKTLLAQALRENRLLVVHEEGGHETPYDVEILPSGDIAIWLE